MKYTAKLDMEFEKETYWAGLAHPQHVGKYMVMGVKGQYDRLN
jgi:hypothetical protein